MSNHWIVWQLCDSAFPAGAFAHSAGLEAAWQAGEVADAGALRAWLTAALQQAARSAAPVVAAAWDGEPPLDQVDAFHDTMLLNHVANRASRAQGQALLMASTKTFDTPALRLVAHTVRRGCLAGHFAPVCGAVARALAVGRAQACEMFQFLTLRGAVSSAVRLGVVGPLQGQALQHQLSGTAADLARQGAEIPLGQAAQTAPLLDLLQATQDRLYSRLFVS